MRDECEHGSLRRSCEICERDVEIAELSGINNGWTERIEELEAENKAIRIRIRELEKALGDVRYAVCCKAWSPDGASNISAIVAKALDEKEAK